MGKRKFINYFIYLELFVCLASKRSTLMASTAQMEGIDTFVHLNFYCSKTKTKKPGIIMYHK